jgi:hypothetical protein
MDGRVGGGEAQGVADPKINRITAHSFCCSRQRCIKIDQEYLFVHSQRFTDFLVSLERIEIDVFLRRINLTFAN